MSVSAAGVLDVQAFDTSLASNTYTVSVQNTITIADNGGTSNVQFAPVDANDKVEFIITLEDGCKTATLSSPTLSSNTLNVDDGSSADLTFTDASDSFGTFLS